LVAGPACCISPALEPLIIAGTNISVAVGLSYNHPRDHLPRVRPGMNVMVSDSTKWVPLIILLLIMLAISLTLLRWARKQDWW
jgi:hypothetical protein